MEDKHTQKSILESIVFKIPIEEFERELNMKGVKEKKEKILELITSYNKLHTQKEYKEIKDNLHEACREGDVELIQIYLSATISNETKTAEFKIDETKHTASLFNVSQGCREFIVPRTIEHDSVEYLITSITGINDNIIILRFEENSSVKTIYGFGFPHFSNLEEIYFPPSLKELKTEWFCNTDKLTKIIISPSNGQFKFINNQYLIGKSDSSNEEFDTLLFGSRDIKEISIPSNINIISSYAFYNCENLIRAEIPPNSNLQTIESNAFSYTKIEEIFIPSKVSKICEGAFHNCFHLRKVLISTNSNLQIIESYAFSESKIEGIFIPSKVSKICEGAFSSCRNLQIVEISEESKLESFPLSAFKNYQKIIIMIPSSLKKLIQ